eukprot:790330-Prorocentrum_lima.AAC.1
MQTLRALLNSTQDADIRAAAQRRYDELVELVRTAKTPLQAFTDVLRTIGELDTAVGRLRE